MTVRIACWAGPRTRSTAMMRSWGARADTTVTDEPLYAHYLLDGGFDHPSRHEILATHDSDWDRVTRWLVGDPPDGARLWFQKHMAKHLAGGKDLAWVSSLRHFVLVRDPARVLASWTSVTGAATVEDSGLPQLVRLRELLTDRLDVAPVVVDTDDVVADPEGMLRALCDVLDVPFDPAMLTWEPGSRDTDGLWARHWYHGVEASTGWGQPDPVDPPMLPAELAGVHAEVAPLYEQLHSIRLTATE